MNDNLNNNNAMQTEEFDQLLRDKLKSHQVAPPSESWDAIAAGLTDVTPQKLTSLPSYRKARIFWISSLAAASVVLLFGLFSLTDLFTSGVSVSSDQFSSAVSASSKVEEKGFSQNEKLETGNIQISDNQLNIFPSGDSVKDKNTFSVNDDFLIKDEKLNQSNVDEKFNVNVLDSLNSLDINKYELIASWDDPIKKHVENDWNISAGLGLNGGLPEVGSMDYFDLAMSDKFVNSSELQSYVPAPNEFRNRTHHLPLSFGLLFSKKIDKGLYLESGLVYTFLHTSFSDMTWGNVKADQKLHYLGVPVNLKVDLLSYQKWSVYLSGGMMFEKGLWSVYEQHQYWNNADQMVLVEKKIDGWQYSLHASTGFAYRIHHKTDLYIEPQLSYFFDQAQPLSVRTEMPLNIGLKAGLRFGL